MMHGQKNIKLWCTKDCSAVHMRLITGHKSYHVQNIYLANPVLSFVDINGSSGVKGAKRVTEYSSVCRAEVNNPHTFMVGL
jgi:hypothetical protein